MATINTLDICKMTVQSLANVARDNYPVLGREKAGFLESLMSDYNRAGFEQIDLDYNDGKEKKKIIRYLQNGDPDLISTNCNVTSCTAGTEEIYRDQLVAITNCITSPAIVLSKAQLRQYCEGTQEVRAAMIMRHMNNFMQKLDRELLALAFAGDGNFYNGVPGGVPGPQAVDLLNIDAGGKESADYSGEIDIFQQYELQGFHGAPIIVGAGKLDRYMKYKGIGCCNQWGQAINEIGKWAYFWDKNVETVFGADEFLTYAPGSMQLITHNENKGDFRVEHEHYMETTIQDPVTGLELDFDLNYDICLKKLTFFFKLQYTLWVPPTDLFAVTDPRSGTNRILNWVATVS